MVDRKKIKSAAIWSAFEALSSAALSIISVVFLARILNPDDYGKIAAAQTIAALMVLVLSLGLTEAVIQRKDLTQKLQLTVLWSTLGLSLFSFLASLVIALYIEHVWNSKIIAIIMVSEGIGAAMQIAAVLPTGLLMKNLEMSALTKRTLISRLCFFAVAIPMALTGFGLWSVVLGSLLQNTIATTLIYVQSRKILPKGFYFNLKDFIELCKFGLFVMVENLLWNVLSRVFSLLILSFHGVAQLGIYNMSTRLTDAILNILNTVIGRMALPVFSSVQDDRNKLINAFYKATKIFNFVSMPAFVGIALTCNDWLPLVLGEHWRPAVPIIQVIAIMNAVMFSRMFVGIVMKAVGQSRRFLYLSLTSAIVAVIAALVTAKLSLIETMITWSSMRVIITIPLGIWLMKRIITLGVIDQLRPVFYPALTTLIMALALILFRHFGAGETAHSILYVVSEIGVGVLAYLLVMGVLFKMKKIDI